MTLFFFFILITELSTTWTDTQKKPVDLNALPSAPRAATAPNIDMSRLPKTPPFTVFIGNLSYEASEDDIQNHFEKNNLNVRTSMYCICMEYRSYQPCMLHVQEMV